jgi:predicted glycosyltransferase
VIARAGYSTIMDLIAIQQKAILVPTPGQKEQEYLGEHLQHHRLFTTVSQAAFNLTKLLQNS